MDDRQVFYPALAMVMLTMVVWLRMYFTRVAEMKRERIHPQSVATSAQMAARISDSRAADNFRNLFELPVLFYLALVVIGLFHLAGTAVLVLAWTFVGLRVIHSAIQCTSNRVMRRFRAYLAGSLVLWSLWAVIAVKLLA